MCVKHIFACVRTCAGQRLSSDAFFYHLLHYYLRQSLYLSLKLINLPWFAGLPIKRLSCLHSTFLGLKKGVKATTARFCVFERDPKLDSHAYSASTLPAKMSPQALACYS